MNKLLKASVLSASCIFLAHCSGNDTSEGVLLDSQRALGTDISNGYYVSSIIVNDGAEQLMENVSVEVNEAERELVYTRVYSE
ncbi:MAG: hypothetical protein AB8B64_22380 [Granulosicoccus sp.]